MWEEHFENYTIFSQISSLNAPMTYLFKLYRTDRYENQSIKWLIFSFAQKSSSIEVKEIWDTLKPTKLNKNNS